MMIMKMSKTSPIPRNRLARLAHLGSLAGSVAGGMLAEGLRQVAAATLPGAADLVLTPSNARRVAEPIPTLRTLLYNAQTGQLGSLDFGATRRYSSTVAEAYCGLLAGALRETARPCPRTQGEFLHRKLGGLYLLAARLRAKVDVRAILEPHLTGDVARATA